MLSILWLTASCDDIFLVVRSQESSTPHNNQKVLELNSFKSRTGRSTPLKYKSHTQWVWSMSALFCKLFFLHLLFWLFCGGVRSQTRSLSLSLTHIFDFSVYSEHSFTPRGSHKQKENLFSWESWEIFICFGHLTKPGQNLLLSQYKEIWGRQKYRCGWKKIITVKGRREGQ